MFRNLGFKAERSRPFVERTACSKLRRNRLIHIVRAIGRIGRLKLLRLVPRLAEIAVKQSWKYSLREDRFHCRATYPVFDVVKQ